MAPKEDEEIVDRKRLFDRIAGEILRRKLAALRAKDEERQSERGGDPINSGSD
jgi:hypothetical protein